MTLEIKKENNIKRVNNILSKSNKSLKDLGLENKRLNKYLEEYNKLDLKKEEKIFKYQSRNKDIEYLDKISSLFEFIKANLFSILFLYELII